MKPRHLIFAFLICAASAYGQMIVLSAPIKDPEMKPGQRTANIVHYEKMRATARGAIRVLALALHNTEDSGPKGRLNEAINNQQDIVDWANWCILALRDKTADAPTCVFHPSPDEKPEP